MREVPTSNSAQNTVLCIRLEHSVAFYVVTITGFRIVAEKRLLASLYPSCPSVRLSARISAAPTGRIRWNLVLRFSGKKN